MESNKQLLLKIVFGVSILIGTTYLKYKKLWNNK